MRFVAGLTLLDEDLALDDKDAPTPIETFAG